MGSDATKRINMMDEDDREIFDKHTVNVIIALLVIDCLLTLLTSVLLGTSIYWTGITVSFIWALIVLKTKMFDWFFVEVPPLRHYVVGSPFKPEQVVVGENDEIQDCTWSGMLRELYPGIRGKYPTEEILRTYNTERQLEIKGIVRVYTANNIPGDVDYILPVSLLAGYLVNFAGRDPEYVIDFLKGSVEGYILSKARSLTEDQLFKSAESQEEFKKQFNGIFGGPNVTHPTEKKLGVFTGCPTITAIRRTKEYEEAAEDVKIAQSFNEAIDQLTNVPPNQRAIFLAAMKGNAHIEYVDLSSFAGKGDLVYNARGAGAAIGNQSKDKKGGK